MIKIETQVHGYRQGHELLSSSTSLPKADQSVVDHLSDVAGPLRPGETFTPYLSAYPLPNGESYVLARTWQDNTVARAGCVRTLSLLIPAHAWALAAGLTSFLERLDPQKFPTDAEPFLIAEARADALPATPEFSSTELLEALFLEEPKPIVLFDAPSPELVAIRLLTALWPSLRARFAMSTFALSPRKIEGRNFDLVFAPKDARSRFANWPGRRVDARSEQGARHRWTSKIVHRVFDDPVPSLLDAHDSLIAESGGDKSSALRMALLWDELMAKLKQSPSAALGLLDIAKTKRDAEVALGLEPALISAAQRAATNLPVPEAWDLISAMARKVHGSQLISMLPSIAQAAGVLADRSPSAALAILDQPVLAGAILDLLPSISRSFNESFTDDVELELKKVHPETLARLVEADLNLAKTVVRKQSLVARLAESISKISSSHFDEFREIILPLLVSDAQIDVARPLLASLSFEMLIEEIKYLSKTIQPAPLSFVTPLAERARELGARVPVMDLLAGLTPSIWRDEFLKNVLTPTIEDVSWLLNRSGLESAAVDYFLARLLREASVAQLSILVQSPFVQPALTALPDDSADVIDRILRDSELPVSIHANLIERFVLKASGERRNHLVRTALERFFKQPLPGDEVARLVLLLGVLGEDLDGKWAAQCGLNNRLSAAILNRNLLAFDFMPESARMRFLEAIESMANALAEYFVLPLSERSASACANLLFDSSQVDSSLMTRASARLLPALLRSKESPVSPIVAVAFPVVYRELAKEDDVGDWLKIIPFLDWDRCKAARAELVGAFLASTVWKPIDLALAALRTTDASRILRRVARSYNGKGYVDKIVADISQLPIAFQEQAEGIISRIRADRSANYDWRE